MRKIVLALTAFVTLFALSVPAQAVPQEIEKECQYYYNTSHSRTVEICKALERETPNGDKFWGRVYVAHAGLTGYDAPYQICCTVTLWEADTNSSNFDVATASTVLWNRGDGDQDYNTAHLDDSQLKCKVHVEAGGAQTGNLAITWIQGGDPDYITNPNNPDVNLGNYGDSGCP